jgi:hypothetical protein
VEPDVIIAVIVSLCATVLLPLAVLAQSSSEAVVMNSGSTNTSGFRISIDKQGEAQYTPMPRRFGATAHAEPVQRKIPDELTQRFFLDLEAAKPLSGLPRGRCRKSASFGSSLTIEFGGERTPDLSCPNDCSLIQNLSRDANEIVALFRSN